MKNRILAISLYFCAIMPALAAWVVIPFAPDVALANVNAGLLLLMAITSIEVYGVIIAGWASNSKYAFLGALRASAQMVSYEIAMGFCFLVVIMVSGSMNLTQIVLGQGCQRLLHPLQVHLGQACQITYRLQQLLTRHGAQLCAQHHANQLQRLQTLRRKIIGQNYFLHMILLSQANKSIWLFSGKSPKTPMSASFSITLLLTPERWRKSS